jgi:hypothetical protein
LSDGGTFKERKDEVLRLESEIKLRKSNRAKLIQEEQVRLLNGKLAVVPEERTEK